MTSPRPTVGQPVAYSRRGWREGEHHESSGAAWVQEHGIAGEDWNFDISQAVGGYLYGYGQGTVSQERRAKAPDGFDVLFYYREPGGTYRAAGLYLRATYLEGDALDEAWAKLVKAGHVKTRIQQIRHAVLPFGEKKAEEAVRVFEEGKHVRWKVRVADAIRYPEQPVITPRRDDDWRHMNAYDWTDHPWSTLIAPTASSDPETDEGRLIMVTHRARERAPDFRAQVVKLRKARLAAGQRLTCEACGFDFGATYGAALADFVEVHHAIPLHTFAAQGGTVKASDLSLLCANCHRAAHRADAWTVPELKALLSRRTP